MSSVDDVRNSCLAIKATQKRSCEDEDIAKAFQLGLGFGFCEKNDNRWIPVGERLPNLNDYDGPKVWQKKVLITGYLSFDDEKGLFVTEAFASDVVHNCVWDTVVVAWMPLPKPYKAESKKKNSIKSTTKKDNYDFLMGFDKGDPFCGEGW